MSGWQLESCEDWFFTWKKSSPGPCSEISAVWVWRESTAFYIVLPSTVKVEKGVFARFGGPWLVCHEGLAGRDDAVAVGAVVEIR